MNGAEDMVCDAKLVHPGSLVGALRKSQADRAMDAIQAVRFAVCGVMSPFLFISSTGGLEKCQAGKAIGALQVARPRHHDPPRMPGKCQADGAMGASRAAGPSLRHASPRNARETSSGWGGGCSAG